MVLLTYKIIFEKVKLFFHFLFLFWFSYLSFCFRKIAVFWQILLIFVELEKSFSVC